MRRIGFAVVLGALVPAAFAGDGTQEEPLSARVRTVAVVELGRRLFMDESVSRAGRFSCASCHDPEHGFSDPRRLSIDENGQLRNVRVLGVKVRSTSRRGTVLFPVEVDLGGGQSEPIDLRFGSTRVIRVGKLRRYGEFHPMPPTPALEKR